MTRVLTFVLAALTIMTAAPAAAQNRGDRGSFPGCPDCGAWSWLDYPAPEATVSARAFVIAGWGFECVSGELIDRVDEWGSRPGDVRDPRAYLVVVRGDSMESMIKRGMRAIISPNLPVGDGEPRLRASQHRGAPDKGRPARSRSERLAARKLQPALPGPVRARD